MAARSRGEDCLGAKVPGFTGPRPEALPVFNRNSAWTSMPGDACLISACPGTAETKGMPTFFDKNSLQERILIPQHQTFVRGTPVALLQGLEGLFIAFDGRFQLLDVLRPPLSEGCLRLSVALLTFLRCGIDLRRFISTGIAEKCARVNSGDGRLDDVPASCPLSSSGSERHPASPSLPRARGSRPRNSSNRGHPGSVQTWARPCPWKHHCPWTPRTQPLRQWQFQGLREAGRGKQGPAEHQR